LRSVDSIFGNAGEDVLVGGYGADRIDGNENDDLIFGDAVVLSRRTGDTTTLRFQTLTGTLLYSRSDLAPFPNGDASGQLLTDGTARSYRDPDGAPDWAAYVILELWHTHLIEAGLDPVAGPNSFGADYIAGGAGHDMIFGQLGNDVIQGDGSIAGALAGAPVGAWRTPGGPSDPLGPL